MERCATIVKKKDESRAKLEFENSSTDEIDDDFDDGGGLKKAGGMENVQNSKETNEDSLKNMCQSNGVQDSNESMDSDSTCQGNADSQNGFENIQNSQIHTENSNTSSDCKDTIDLNISAS